MNWMQLVNMQNINYEGWDIMEDAIENNKIKFYDKENMKFYCRDVLSNNLPKVDLIFCRDMIIHFPLSEI